MRVFNQVADVKLISDLDDIKRPEAKFEVVKAQRSEIQAEMVDELSERASAISQGRVPKEEDNMLKITTDGRKIGLDQRLINDMLPDEPGSKINLCINNVKGIYDETATNKLTQLVFCDYSTPKESIWTLSKSDLKGMTEAQKTAALDARC